MVPAGAADTLKLLRRRSLPGTRPARVGQCEAMPTSSLVVREMHAEVGSVDGGWCVGM